MKVLLVEDEIDLAESVADFLESHACEVTCAPDGQSGLRLTQATTFDMLIVDVGLPRMDGVTLVQNMRAAGCRTPVLFLTSRDTPEDKLAGFAAGADDYQVKPCPLPELLARITAIHARAQTAQPTEKPVISDKNEGRTLPARLTVGDLTIDREQHRAWRDGEELELPPTCFTLLWELALASPAVVTRKAMEEALWGNDLPPGSDPLRSHLYKLRQALLEKNDNPLLHTVRGVGARLE